ncbi:MAG: redoxin family protein [Clostridia bacterium]|nr:redoxin family protein [Clostridia bacterium]
MCLSKPLIFVRSVSALDKIKNWIKSHIPTQRRLVQLYAALLYNAHLKGYITGNIYTGAVKNLCVPGFNCYSCPGAVGACPLGALQNAVAASGSRAPTYVLGVLLLYGLIFGRTVCGWLCPVGLMQELLHKIPTVKIRKNFVTRILSWLKYVILAVFVIIIPFLYSPQSYPVPAFCKYICPEGTFGGAIGLLANPVNFDKFSMLGILFTRKFVIMLIIIGLCIFIYRAFCRFICPLGAIYGLFAKVCVLGVKVEAPKCTDCGRCVRECPMDIRRAGDHECIHCGKCIDVCPTKAISFKAGRIILRGPQIDAVPEKKRRVRKLRLGAWAAALVLLVFALWFFNKPAAAPEKPEPAPAETVAVSETQAETTPETEAAVEPAVPVGFEAGMRAPDFAVPLYPELQETFRLSDHRGKTVVINFWATWCTPCCNELPHFDELYRKYPEDIAMIAIHSSLVTEDVPGYLGKLDYRMPFGLDESGDVIAAFNGSTMLPQTVVVDANGIITYNAVGSVTYEKLEKLAAEAAVD